MSYKVKLEVFEGPLDLLLYLIQIFLMQGLLNNLIGLLFNLVPAPVLASGEFFTLRLLLINYLFLGMLAATAAYLARDLHATDGQSKAIAGVFD